MVNKLIHPIIVNCDMLWEENKAQTQKKENKFWWDESKKVSLER